MPEDTVMFWLIHLFVGLIFPAMMLIGCCREDEEEAPESRSTPRLHGGGGVDSWETGRAK